MSTQRELCIINIVWWWHWPPGPGPPGFYITSDVSQTMKCEARKWISAHSALSGNLQQFAKKVHRTDRVKYYGLKIHTATYWMMMENWFQRIFKLIDKSRWFAARSMNRNQNIDRSVSGQGPGGGFVRAGNITHYTEAAHLAHHTYLFLHRPPLQARITISLCSGETKDTCSEQRQVGECTFAWK